MGSCEKERETIPTTFGSDETPQCQKRRKSPQKENKSPDEEARTHSQVQTSFVVFWLHFSQVLIQIQNWIVGFFNYLKSSFQTNIETMTLNHTTRIETSREESCEEAEEDLVDSQDSALESPIDSEVDESSFSNKKLLECEITEEEDNIGRYRDANDGSSTDGGENTVEMTIETALRIKAQVELMFSDDYLAKDGFLLKHVRRRSDGYVSLKLIAGLRKVKQISREFQTVLDSLQKSDKLEVNEEGTKIRRLDPLTPFLQTLPISSQNKDKNAVNSSGNGKGRNFYHRRSSSPAYGSYSSGAENSDDPNFAQKCAPYKYRKSSFPNKYQQWSKKQNNNNVNFYNYNNWQNSSSENLKYNQQQMFRRRGGSLPVQPENTILDLSANSSLLSNLTNELKKESNSSEFGRRAKSFSYYEGGEAATNLMNPWLRRRQSSWRNSDSCLAPSSVIRQPMGPDGSKGFSSKRNSLTFPIFEPYDS